MICPAVSNASSAFRHPVICAVPRGIDEAELRADLAPQRRAALEHTACHNGLEARLGLGRAQCLENLVLEPHAAGLHTSGLPLSSTRCGDRAELGRKSRMDLFVCESVTSSLKTWWRDIEEMMSVVLWHPLEDVLRGVEKIVFVTHGSLHLLPIDAVLPENLDVVSYPGLLYFLERRGLLEIEPPKFKTGVDLGFCCYESTPEKLVGIREVECRAIEKAYKIDRVRIEKEGLFDGIAACVDTLIIACHNEPLVDRNLLYSLEIGKNKFLTYERMRKSSVYAKNVYASTCLSSVIEEDSDGNPMGLYTSFWLHGTKVVVGSIVSIAEDWAPILSVLLFQCIHNEEETLEKALRVAKRRLRTGQWYEDTEEVLRLHVGEAWKSFLEWQLATDISPEKEKNKRLIMELFKHYGDNKRFLDRIGESETADQFLKKYSNIDRDRGLVDLIRTLSSAVVEARLDQRIPPEPILSSMVYGMKAFGETRL